MEQAVDTIFDQIASALARGDRVELRGFGTFAAKVREGRVGRNPRTGAKVHVPEKKIPYFRPGHEIRQRLNSGAAGIEDSASID
jgi:integration host factor subunit beta